VKKYLIAGLALWLALAITIWVLQAALFLLDGVVQLASSTPVARSFRRPPSR